MQRHQTQGDGNSRSHCLITINLLCTLKIQLSGSALYTPLEQCLLSVAFSLAFNGFMRVIEFTLPSSSNSFLPPDLHWSDVELLNFWPLLSHLHCVSQEHPFQKGQCITITAMNTSICPVCALHCYANATPLVNQSGPLSVVVDLCPLFQVQVTFTTHQLSQGK